MGTITDNFNLSPRHSTIIATCPLVNDRVSWAWLSNDNGASKLLFPETLTPPDEDVGLLLADYDNIYSGDILIDLAEFKVSSECTGVQKQVH